MNRVFTTIGDINDISGFFQKYNTINNAHFVSLFGSLTEHDIETLDFLISDVFGGKVLTQKYSDINNESGADVLMGRIVSIADKYFYNNWLSFKQSIETAFNSSISKPLESVKTIETQKTGENETLNKLNAFDSSVSSDTDSADISYSDNFSTTETTHYSNGKTPAENAKEQIDFVKNNDLIELIINDVVSICCLDIYDENYTCSRTSSGGGSGGGSDPELENRVTQCENDITGIKKLIPTTATEENKLATIADVQSGYDDTELRGLIQKNTDDIQGIYNDLTGYATKQELQAVENSIPDVSGLATKTEVQSITDLIPSNATEQNKLATMADIGGGGGGGGGSYYTVGQEVDTGNIYKDGSTEKPIYRRVINVPSVTQGSDVDVNVSFTGATRFINITGSYNLNGVRHGMGYYNQSGTKGVQAEVRMSLVRFSVMGSGLTFKDVSLIIEYIK